MEIVFLNQINKQCQKISPETIGFYQEFQNNFGSAYSELSNNRTVSNKEYCSENPNSNWTNYVCVINVLNMWQLQMHAILCVAFILQCNSEYP